MSELKAQPVGVEGCRTREGSSVMRCRHLGRVSHMRCRTSGRVSIF